MNMFGEIEGLRVARSFRFNNFDNGRDHFARFFDDHRVADADVFAFDFILVMQRCPPNSASAYQHRLQHCYRRQNSRAADLNHDVIQAGLHALSLVFVSDGPSWRFCGEPEPLALRKRIHFHYGAVGLISEFATDAVQFVYGIQNFFH